MAVTINSNQLNTTGSFQSYKTFTQSTATAFQTLSFTHNVNVLGMGTATGFGVNRYALPTTAPEGAEVMITSNATGEAKVFVPAVSGRMPIAASSLAIPTATTVDAVWASATGLWVLGADGSYILCKVVNGLWDVVSGRSATLATAT